MAVQGFGGGVASWMVFKKHLVVLPPISTARDTLDGRRIPRPAPEQEGETPPGLICWGSVGELPSPEPLPVVNFTVNFPPDEVWTEKERETEEVRIENPDDPEQYIMVDRAQTSTWQKGANKSPAGPNTATEVPPGTSNYVDPGETYIDPNTWIINPYGDGPKPERSGKVRMHYIEPRVPSA